MPIGMWWHAADKKVVSLDEPHLMADIVPPQFLQALLDGERSDTRHQGARLTVTGGLGCPRATFIERALPAIVDPLKRVAMTMGTALHEHLGRWTAATPMFKEWLTEGRDNGKCEVRGRLFGVEVSGKMDLHCHGGGKRTIWDWKTSFSDKSAFVKADEMAGQEHAAQLNMCRLLHEQTHGMMDTTMVIWHVGRTLIRQECAVMDEDAIGRVRPGSTKNGQCSHTVREIFGLLKGAYDGWEAGADAEVVAASLPFVGQTQWVSAKKTNACTNCAVAQTCERLATGGML